MTHKKRLLSNSRGFTLVELAIVLIIIGIIIGAVVKGKNLIRTAEQKKIYSKFINEWRLSYLNFYDRTGKILGDFYDAAGTAAGQDGRADTDNDGGGAIIDAERAYLYSGGGTSHLGLLQVGMAAPTTNTSTNYEFKYTDSVGAAHTVTAAFSYEATGTYNYLLITEIPNELAIALDTMVDGSADGAAGDFLNGTVNNDEAAGVAWGTDDAAPGYETAARWKMEF